MSRSPFSGLAYLSPTQVLRLDQLCDQYETEWKAGRQPRMKEYLAALAAGPPTPPAILWAILQRELLALDQLYRSPPQVTLEVTAGPHEGRRFSFPRHDIFIVGRSKHAHFRLPAKDRYFSRIHFLVEANPPQCQLTDLGSRNGTFVNGQKVRSAGLHDGDLIKAGRTILRVSISRGEDAIVPENLVPPHLVPAQGRAGLGRQSSAALGATSAAQVPVFPTVPPEGRKICRLCTALLVTAVKPLANARDRVLIPLCTGCEEQIGKRPQPIPGYLIARELGRGAMGIVYQALHKASGTVVALKTITPAVAGSRTQSERFLREAGILRQLDHPHIVSFRDLGESNGQFFFAMDYVRGTDARRLLKNHGPLVIGRAVRLVCQLLEALTYAHARGFVHRDIKPSNLLLKAANDHEVLMLADFGLARVYQASALSGLTLTGDVGGTTAFMPPEQITAFHDAKPAADQYSAGATLYNMLTGKYVYDLPPGKFEDQLAMILQEDPVPIRERRPDIPRPLAAIIHKALARIPGKRFGDVEAMRQALHKYG
jgi:serine/threonine-protein kinase